MLPINQKFQPKEQAGSRQIESVARFNSFRLNRPAGDNMFERISVTGAETDGRDNMFVRNLVSEFRASDRLNSQLDRTS